MKGGEKDSEKVFWDQMRSAPTAAAIVGQVTAQSRLLSKLLLWLICFISFTYLVYTLKLLSSFHGCSDQPFFAIHRHWNGHSSSSSSSSSSAIPIYSRNSSSSSSSSSSISNRNSSSSSSATAINSGNSTRVLSSSPPVRRAYQETQNATELRHLVFGIAASAKLWQQRKNYIKLWFNPQKMKGIVWLDKPVKTQKDEKLPPVKISGDTSRFSYSNRQGHRSAIRISRIVSETLRLNLPDVRWFVMGDDDTFFITENLIRILRKYDHNQLYYIGSSSESHLQNIYFSYAMAYGGGGFAISYPLAKALEKMQDKCIQRYPGLYGSDDRMQACMSELGVPLTRELGFHQYDVYGNLFGLLAAHPVTPFVSLHHLDVVEPIFPNVTRVDALKRLNVPMQLDSAALMQQSICYDRSMTWTISVSWGFAVQIFKGVLSPREVEMPSRTFLNWYRRADYTAYAFNTRPVSRNPCQKPVVFYLSKARFDANSNRTKSTYERHRVPSPTCKWKIADPSQLDIVEVLKTPDPNLWDRSPRRNCCRITESKKANTMVVDVGVCGEGEISEI